MADRLPQITSKELIRALERLGFVVRRITGGHVIMRHPSTKRIAVIPNHGRDLRRGTLFGIIKQSSVSIEELRSVL